MNLPLETGYFRYHLVQCADETRDERLNVGVLVIDPVSGQATCRTAPTLERIEQNLPEVPLPHLKLVLQVIEDSAAQGYTPEGLAELDRQIEQQAGTLRLSDTRSIQGASVEETAEALLNRYVLLPERESSYTRRSGG